MRAPRVLLLLGLAAAGGLAIFGYLVWTAVETEQVESPRALQEFAAARAVLGPAEPMLRMEASGAVVPGSLREAGEGARSLSELKVLAYHAETQRLVRASVPFWFLQLKGPAIEFALGGVDIDLEQLGVTTADLQRHGPGLVFEADGWNGYRLLIWTESPP